MKKKWVLSFENSLFLVIMFDFYEKEIVLHVYHMINQMDIENKSTLTLNYLNICLFPRMIWVYQFFKSLFVFIVIFLCISKKDKKIVC